jgi:adenosine deaminase
LEHSFLPGESLWDDTVNASNVPPCEIALRKPGQVSPACKAVLDHSERASEQWKLEKAFAEFEKKF